MTIVLKRVYSLQLTLEAGTVSQLDRALTDLRSTLEERLGQLVPAGTGVRVLSSKLIAEGVKA